MTKLWCSTVGIECSLPASCMLHVARCPLTVDCLDVCGQLAEKVKSLATPEGKELQAQQLRHAATQCGSVSMCLCVGAL